MLLPVLLCAFVTEASGSSRPGSSEQATSDSTRIAFVRGTRELVLVDSDGRNQTVVRLRPRFDISAFSWAPGGHRLAISATTPGFKEHLYVVGANGRGLHRLAQWEDFGSVPAWSPRGKTILVDKHNDGDHQLWLVKADGSGARKLTPVEWFNGPTWSPDGKRIALFGRGRGKNVLAHGIYVMKADGSARRRIVPTSSESTAPVWSPANQIVYYQGDDLWSVNPDGSGKRIAIADTPETWEPGPVVFTRDGRKVAFFANFAVRNPELLAGDISTGVMRRMTNNAMADYSPSWSPDGSSLVFERSRPAFDAPGDIYVMNADGSGERNLTNSALNEWTPKWAPR
jgi:Tol biopolymer transport system component